MRSPGSRIASAKWRNWPRVQTLLPRSPPRPLLSSLNSTSISSLLSAPRSNFRCVGKMHRADNSPRLPLYFARGPFCDLAQKLCELSLQDPKNQFKASQDGPGKGTAQCSSTFLSFWGCNSFSYPEVSQKAFVRSHGILKLL